MILKDEPNIFILKKKKGNGIAINTNKTGKKKNQKSTSIKKKKILTTKS